jgi:hypothetical protein
MAAVAVKPTGRPFWQAASPRPSALWLLPVPELPAGELHHQRLVQGRQGREVEAVEALHGREPGGLDAALHHAPIAVDQLLLGQPQQEAGIVDALGGTQPRDLVILAQEGRQLQRLEVVSEQDLWRVVHDRPASRAMYDLANVVATVALGRYG